MIKMPLKYRFKIILIELLTMFLACLLPIVFLIMYLFFMVFMIFSNNAYYHLYDQGFKKYAELYDEMVQKLKPEDNEHEEI